MADAPSRAPRILLPVVLLLLGGLIIAWPLITGQGQTQPQQPDGQAADPPAETPTGAPADAAESIDDEPGPQPADDQSDIAADEPVDGPADAGADAPTDAAGDQPPARTLRVRPVEGDPSTWTYTPLGGLDPSADQMEVTFSLRGAGVERIRLAGYRIEIGGTERVIVQEEAVQPLASGGARRLVPFAAVEVAVGGARVPVFTAGDRPAWRERAPGDFEAIIEDADANAVVRLTRTYALDGYVLTLTQAAENLTDEPLDVRWTTFGPVELAPYGGATNYGGDIRRFRFGYAAPNAPGFVAGQEYIASRDRAAGSRDKVALRYAPVARLWPNDAATKQGYELVWTGVKNRYFGVAVFGLANGSAPAPVLDGVDRVNRVMLDPGAVLKANTMGIQLVSSAQAIPPGRTATTESGIYAGPLSREIISDQPAAAAAQLSSLVQYSFGGPCAVCTFQWLAHALIGLLDVLHDYIAHDWALAIILLVFIVRGILHPVTRWSQIRVQRFSHQMQQMAPKQKKIQEKYKGDPKRMQAEMAKLWREEGVNPAGLLGCLPMFMQTPVWIALYASLFFAIELRHEAAFFGVFQMLGNWQFLADLARPDAAIPLPASWHFTPPLIGGLYGTITAINVLPLLLGVVFFIQQKYMMPPQTATLSPEQQAQQKMIKFMMVVMFPIFMYTAPSGLTIYFISNSVLGIVESRWIRAHINKNDLLETPKRDPGKPGMLQRLISRAEERQRMIQEARGVADAKGPTSGALGARRKHNQQRRRGRGRP
ncbi:MAG: membrane protein insertase YidC [Planctomycetota bacterium]